MSALTIRLLAVSKLAVTAAIDYIEGHVDSALAALVAIIEECRDLLRDIKREHHIR